MRTCAAGWREPGVRQRLDLTSGDALMLYTDGVTEALNGEGEMFGEEPLRDVITASLDASADETIGAICGALAVFTGGAEPADDVTVVVRVGGSYGPTCHEDRLQLAACRRVVTLRQAGL